MKKKMKKQELFARPHLLPLIFIYRKRGKAIHNISLIYEAAQEICS